MYKQGLLSLDLKSYSINSVMYFMDVGAFVQNPWRNTYVCSHKKLTCSAIKAFMPSSSEIKF